MSFRLLRSKRICISASRFHFVKTKLAMLPIASPEKVLASKNARASDEKKSSAEKEIASAPCLSAGRAYHEKVLMSKTCPR